MEKEIFGGKNDTTNNQMELLAAIEGLATLKELCNWKNTERIGIIKTNNYEQLLHPSQNILIEMNKIDELTNIASSPLFDWNLKEKTSMIIWS